MTWLGITLALVTGIVVIGAAIFLIGFVVLSMGETDRSEVE